MLFRKQFIFILLAISCLLSWALFTAISYGQKFISGEEQENELYCVFACMRTIMPNIGKTQCELATEYAKNYLYKSYNCCDLGESQLPPDGDYSPAQQSQLLRDYTAACLGGVRLSDFCDFAGRSGPLTLIGSADNTVPTYGYPTYGLIDWRHCIVLCGAHIDSLYGRWYYTLYYYDPYYGYCTNVSGTQLPSYIYIYRR